GDEPAELEKLGQGGAGGQLPGGPRLWGRRGALCAAHCRSRQLQGERRVALHLRPQSGRVLRVVQGQGTVARDFCPGGQQAQVVTVEAEQATQPVQPLFVIGAPALRGTAVAHCLTRVEQILGGQVFAERSQPRTQQFAGGASAIWCQLRQLLDEVPVA